MTNPAVRSAILVFHIFASVGWAGGISVFLALTLVGLASAPVIAAAVAVAMNIACVYIIVPLSLVSPVTGIGLGLMTRWGLAKHYWVLFKLLMTLASTALLQLHMGPIAEIAEAAAAGRPLEPLVDLRRQMALDAGIALIVLLIAGMLAVFKPAGKTPWRRR